MKRELLELPPELIGLIFAKISDEWSTRHVVRLRLVCRYFNEAFYTGYYAHMKPTEGIRLPTSIPITGDFLYRHMKSVRFSLEPHPWGEFARTVEQTVKNLLHYMDKPCSKTPDQFAQELCSMAVEFSKIWYPLLRARRGGGHFRGKWAIDHTLVALAYFGMTAAFESLLPACQNAIPTNDHFGKAHYWAIRRGHTHIVKILLKRQHQIPSECFGSDGHPPLSLAARYGHLNLVKLIMLHDDIGSKHVNDALRSAAQAGQLDALKLIVKNTPQHSNLGNWPLEVLISAALSGQGHIVDFALTEHDADIIGILTRDEEILTRGFPYPKLWERPAIYAAASHGYVGTVSYLLAKGAHYSGPWGNALARAVRRGYTRTVEVLLKAGADLNTVDLEA